MRLAFCILLAMLFGGCGRYLERNSAIRSVKAYVKSAHSDYVPNGFGEFFEQTYPREIEEAIGTTGRVKYSLVHSYLADGTSHTGVYFHLDENFEVLGSLTMDQMTDLTMTLIAPALKEIVGSDTLSSGAK